MNAVFADCKCHGTKSPDWRDLHDPVDHEEKDVGSFFNKFVDWVTGAAQELEGKAENDREEQDLENVALRKGPDNGGGNDMKQKVQSRLRLFGCCIHRGGIHI